MARKKIGRPPVAQPAPPVAVEAPPKVTEAKRVTYTAAETQAVLPLIRQMLIDARTVDDMHSLITQKHFITKARVRVLCERVRLEWEREDADKRALWKAQAIRRLTRIIRVAQGIWDVEAKGWREKPNYALQMQAEQTLAKIQGTFAPTEFVVDVNISKTLVNVIAELTPEQTHRYLERHRETQAAADAWRRQHALPAAKEG